MKRIGAVFVLAIAVASCGSGDNPFNTTDDDTGTGTDTGTPVTRTTALPPGTATPTRTGAVFRTEEGGYASGIEYRNDRGQDEFYVDNLAFDGDNSYQRGQAVAALGGINTGATPYADLGTFNVYEADAVTRDPVTGTLIGNLDYRALYGVSRSGNSEFAIVRSGSYEDYGFGGFVYQRNAGANLVLPTCSGDCTASFAGSYAGIRVFEGRTGLEYGSGNAEMFVDFEDFNDGQAGVALYVRDRRIYDINGNDITAEYVAALEDVDTTTSLTNVGAGTNVHLPDLVSVVDPTNGDANGELSGELSSSLVTSDGSSSTLESGNYYAIMAGSGADMEVTGVLVVTSTDPRSTGVTVQETGGIILYRQ